MPLDLSTRPPTDRPEALKSFVEGREKFRAYLSSGKGTELEKASQLFDDATKSDPNFDLATFYHAVTRTELRDAEVAIEELQSLINKKVDFIPEAYLHLAYAHTKRYLDDQFYEAERALNCAREEAKAAGDKELEPVIDAYRVFLYSVMGGRLKEADPEKKQDYLEKAIELGEGMLRKRLRHRDRYSSSLIRLELHNALGIAYMGKGKAGKTFSEDQKKWWGEAERHLQAALDLDLNPVRVLQNRGTLFRIQGKQWIAKDRDVAERYFRDAVAEYQASVAINPLDQFPHFALAELYGHLGQWEMARHHLTYGRQQKGAVHPELWEGLERAVESEDARLLDRTAV